MYRSLEGPETGAHPLGIHFPDNKQQTGQNGSSGGSVLARQVRNEKPSTHIECTKVLVVQQTDFLIDLIVSHSLRNIKVKTRVEERNVRIAGIMKGMQDSIKGPESCEE